MFEVLQKETEGRLWADESVNERERGKNGLERKQKGCGCDCNRGDSAETWSGCESE